MAKIILNLISGIGLISGFWSFPAYAQDEYVRDSLEDYHDIVEPIDENNVDIRIGDVLLPAHAMGFDGAGGALRWTVQRTGYRVKGWDVGLGGFVDERRDDELYNDEILVFLSGKVSRFKSNSSGLIGEVGGNRGEELTFDSANNIYHFTGRNGLKATFQKGLTSFPNRAELTKVIAPNGHALTYHYRCMAFPQYLDCQTVLNSVNSNVGFQVRFEYDQSGNWTDFNVGGLRYSPIRKVVLVNSSIQECDPAQPICTLPTGVWPTQQMNYSVSEVISGNLKTETVVNEIIDPDGRSTQYIRNSYLEAGSGGWWPTGGRLRIVSPPSPEIAYESAGTVVKMDSVTIGGTQKWEYDYVTLPDGNRTVQRKAPDNSTVSFQNEKYHVDSWERHNETRRSYNYSPSAFVDELNRTTSYDWESDFRNDRIKSVTFPEGNAIVYTYDGRGNVIEKRQKAKPGSGSADIVESATYPAACATAKNCNRPTAVTDARGAVTAYTYSADHGGVLTKVGPSIGGTSAATKYSYAQRYAWIKSGSTYVQSGEPVWLLTEERSCRTSALNLSTGACAAGAGDLVQTLYEYGPNAGPNNLWLRGVAIVADGQTLRSCYGYDATGRKLSETKPSANLGNCP